MLISRHEAKFLGREGEWLTAQSATLPITDTDLKHYRNCKRIACCECARVESNATADR